MAKHQQTQSEWELTMARRILAVTRSELYMDLPYLNPALCALSWQPNDSLAAFATDGNRLYYAPKWVIRLYRANRRYLPRAFLHSVLHCVFRHLWLRGGRDAALWNLACDIAVESVLDGLDRPSLTRPIGWLRQKTYAELRRQCRVLSAGPIYRALCQKYAPEEGGADAALKAGRELQKLQREFVCDSHALWPKDENSPAARAAGKQWEQLGRQTQLSMQQSGQNAGSGESAAALDAQVSAGRSRRLYRDFLRRFAALREEPHLSPDEFDLGYYTYGLSVYGNMPLIEPLESREVKKIRDFVIVLDTSDSTSGALVKAFLKETFTLLKTGDSFFSRCNIWVLQCDDRVRSETCLTDLNALERYMNRFTLVGGGGTDFRPAFARVAEMIRQGLLKELKGVLYFTDGKGVYPAKRPPFETAFLFLDDGTPPPDVPAWAMKLVLEPEELLPAAAPDLPDFSWEEEPDLPEL
ncbi:MAG: VWA-like domain-containing protein [Gemmiger sp.]